MTDLKDKYPPNEKIQDYREQQEKNYKEEFMNKNE